MKTSVNRYDFEQAFKQADRDNFSYEGLGLLFDYLEEYEESTGTEIELDVIAICCDYLEDTWQSIAQAYSIELDHDESEEDQKQQVRDFLEVETIIVGNTEGGFVYACF